MMSIDATSKTPLPMSGNYDNAEYPKRDQSNLIAAAIDFGNSAIRAAVIDTSNDVRIIPNQMMEQETRSIVAYADAIKVGSEAGRTCLEDPENAIFDLKDLIGKNFEDIISTKKSWPFIVIDHDGKPEIQVNYKNQEMRLTPSEVTRELFQVVINNMMASINEKSIEQVIITIPPYFTSNQRKALLEIAKRDEFKNILLINDITAILYRHIMQDISEEELEDANYMVCNFGYSSFDCGVFSVRSGNIRPKYIVSRTDLSGKLITKAIMLHIVKQTLPEDLEYLKLDKKKWIRLKSEAEKIKKLLSYQEQFIFEYRSLEIMSEASIPLNADDMEMIVSIMFTTEDVSSMMELAFEKSGIRECEIDQVFLSGGSSRIPFLSNFVQNQFPEGVVVNSVHPEMDAIIGATLYSRERIADRRVHNLSHLEDVRLLNLVARNITTNQSLILLPHCNKLAQPHLKQGFFSTDSDEIRLEISECHLNANEASLVSVRTKELTVPHDKEVPFHFKVYVDENGIASITDISTFNIKSDSNLIDGDTSPTERKTENIGIADTSEEEDGDNNEANDPPHKANSEWYAKEYLNRDELYKHDDEILPSKGGTNTQEIAMSGSFEDGGDTLEDPEVALNLMVGNTQQGFAQLVESTIEVTTFQDDVNISEEDNVRTTEANVQDISVDNSAGQDANNHNVVDRGNQAITRVVQTMPGVQTGGISGQDMSIEADENNQIDVTTVPDTGFQEICEEDVQIQDKTIQQTEDTVVGDIESVLNVILDNIHDRQTSEVNAGLGIVQEDKPNIEGAGNDPEKSDSRDHCVALLEDIIRNADILE